MITAFSERLMPPFSGQVQIAQSDTYRALTLDGKVWEIQYVKRSHVRVATLSADELKSRATRQELLDGDDIADEELTELLDYLSRVELPFAANDNYEYWLLEAKSEKPLALIFTCTEAAQMDKFPNRAEWTALPAAVMPIEKTQEEIDRDAPPINYQLERLVAERAGNNAKARWFNRTHDLSLDFPPLMVREDWADAGHQAICRRYIERQSPRLLMLQGLDTETRQRLESYCRQQAVEVARFCEIYPEICNEVLIKSLRVEARLRGSADDSNGKGVQNRRDGVLYI